MQIDYEKLMGEYVAYHRKAKSPPWTQQDLADRMAERGEPIHATAITRFERGARSLRLNEWIALMDVLERPLPNFFEYVETVQDFGGRLERELDAIAETPLTILDHAETVEAIVGMAHKMISEELDKVRQAGRGEDA